MADPDSDDDSTFVTLGTPLEVFEEDEVPKKPVHLEDQAVRDNKGRQRFHGAFTGGFSAGYFNTVGSEEGWTPSTFVSSRTKKAKVDKQMQEDFMDVDDLSEHGITPRILSTTEDFASGRTRKRKTPATSSGSIIPGDLLALGDLIMPARIPVGVRLLRGLGWKEGQGVGLRVKRKRKVRHPPGKKVYGCALPTDQAQDSSEDDEYAAGLTFAPKDVNPINFNPKDNTHGIGYRGIDPTSLLGSRSGPLNLFEAPAITKTGRKGITGQAFGVGALEDDDDDIYHRDNMSNYDRVLGGEDDHLHGWTAPRQHRQSGPQRAIEAAVSHVQWVLEGFKLAQATDKHNQVYPPLRVPRDYRPVHVFLAQEAQSASITRPEKSQMTASSRAAMLGEIGSVFDLVNKAGKEKIVAAKKLDLNEAASAVPLNTPSIGTQQKAFMPAASPEQNETSSASVLQESMKQASTPASNHGTSGFKPFSKVPLKQHRYEQYLELKKHGRKAEISNLQGSMTEWERQRELVEFDRASQLFKPMSFLMASRFHLAKFDDNVDDASLPADDAPDQSDHAKAAAMKMFGKLTRESFEWHPDKVLCKRFNIPNPYPESTVVGLPTVRRDKFSIFNFLSVPTPAPPPPPPPDKPATTLKAQKPNIAPLAILNAPHSQSLNVPQRQEMTEVQLSDKSVEPEVSVESQSSEGQGMSTTVETKGTDQRPPMDLYKAIFADSESSGSSSEDDDKMDDDVDKNDDSADKQDKINKANSAKSEDDMHTQPEHTQLPSKSQEANKTGSTQTLAGHREKSESATPGRLAVPSKSGIFDQLNAQITREKSAEAATSIELPPDGASVAPVQVAPASDSGRLEEMYGPKPPSSSDNVYGPALPPGPPESSTPHTLNFHQDRDRGRDGSRDRERSKGRDRRKKGKKDKDKNRSRNRSTDRKRNNDKERSRDRERSRNTDNLKDTDRKRDGSKSRDRRGDGRKEQDRSCDTKSKRHESEDSDSAERHKEKKHKKKKTKHKKHKRKHSAKHKGAPSSDAEDADSEDNSSNSDISTEIVPSNSAILQRLKMLKTPK